MFDKLNILVCSIGLTTACLVNSIHSSEIALLGGADTSGPYAASLFPSGATAKLVLDQLVGTGQIFSVAINSSGAGLVGGQDLDFFPNGIPYVARVFPSGATAKLALDQVVGTGFINSVAINSSGAGLVGGRDNGNTTPYTARVFPSGATAKLALDQLVGDGVILSVAINTSGAGLVGGSNNGFSAPYAARVFPSGATAKLALDQFVGTGFINSVAINSSGAGLVGGVTITLQLLTPPAFFPLGRQQSLPLTSCWEMG